SATPWAAITATLILRREPGIGLIVAGFRSGAGAKPEGASRRSQAQITGRRPGRAAVRQQNTFQLRLVTLSSGMFFTHLECTNCGTRHEWSELQNLCTKC